VRTYPLRVRNPVRDTRNSKCKTAEEHVLLKVTDKVRLERVLLKGTDKVQPEAQGCARTCSSKGTGNVQSEAQEGRQGSGSALEIHSCDTVVR
jgi:hypothetical protein